MIKKTTKIATISKEEMISAVRKFYNLTEDYDLVITGIKDDNGDDELAEAYRKLELGKLKEKTDGPYNYPKHDNIYRPVTNNTLTGNAQLTNPFMLSTEEIDFLKLIGLDLSDK